MRCSIHLLVQLFEGRYNIIVRYNKLGMIRITELIYVLFNIHQGCEGDKKCLVLSSNCFYYIRIFNLASLSGPAYNSDIGFMSFTHEVILGESYYALCRHSTRNYHSLITKLEKLIILFCILV